MKIYKAIRKLYDVIAFRIYDITSKHIVMETSKLFDTPRMTKYHHIVSALRYVAIEEHYGINDYGKMMYRTANHFESDEEAIKDIERFNALICSIETKGYDMSSKIYVDLDGNCINGTHRLALCAWFGVQKVPVVIIRRHLKPKTISELKEYYRLNDEDFRRLEDAYQKMYNSFHKA